MDMLILKTLSLQPLHAFGIGRRIEQISRGVFRVNPGSLFTALERLVRAGWLDAGWETTENGRRATFYSLTRAGKKQLEVETADWTRRASARAGPPRAGPVAQEPRFHRREHPRPRARHRVDHRHLQRGDPDPLRAAALPRCRSRDDGLAPP